MKEFIECLDPAAGAALIIVFGTSTVTAVGQLWTQFSGRTGLFQLFHKWQPGQGAGLYWAESALSGCVMLIIGISLWGLCRGIICAVCPECGL